MITAIAFVALGDSLSVGTGARFSSGFIKPYSLFTESVLQRPLHINTVAKNGMTSLELLSIITSNTFVRNTITKANIITITIGGNDLLQATRNFQRKNDFRYFKNALNEVTHNLSAILSEIRHLKSSTSTPYFIRIIGLYNPFPNIPYSDLWVNRFNTLFQSFTNHLTRYVNITHLKNRQLLSVDGLHPNHDGYRLIAKQLEKNGYYPFL